MGRSVLAEAAFVKHTWTMAGKDILDRIRELTDERDDARQRADNLTRQWHQMISVAVKGGVLVSDVASAAGITTSRVYQIRDERR
jgi:hypothetical protein